MSADEASGKERHEAADHLKQIEKHLAEEDRRLEQLKEEIREAEKKGKIVEHEPQP
jgi:hypothetical protein